MTLKLRLAVMLIVTSISMDASAQTPVVEPIVDSHQVSPAVNHSGMIAYRSQEGPVPSSGLVKGSGNALAVFWSDTSGTVPHGLATGLPIPLGTYQGKDGLAPVLTQSYGVYIEPDLNSLGMFGTMKLSTLQAGSPAVTLYSLPPAMGGMRKIRHLSAWENEVGELTAAWSEYKTDRWIAVAAAQPLNPVSPPVVFEEFDVPGADILGPSIGGGDAGLAVAVTARTMSHALCCGRYAVHIFDLTNRAHSTIDNAKIVSFVKNEGSGPVAFVYERYLSGGLGAIEMHVVGAGEVTIPTLCESPRMPRGSWTNAGAAVLYVCDQPLPEHTELRLSVPDLGCDVKVASLGYSPIEAEPHQFDIAGDNIVYAQHGAYQMDVMYDIVTAHCPEN